MKTILFPTQFSREATERLKSACRLALPNGARIIVLVSIHIPDGYTYANAAEHNAFLKAEYQKSESAFKSLESKAQADFTEKIHIDLEISIGNLASTILEAAEKFNPQAILIGGEVYGKVNAVTEKLIQKLTCPVLAIPINVKLDNAPKLVYATNFRKEDRRIIDKLLNFAMDFSGSLHCIHIEQDRGKHDYNKVLPWHKGYQKEIDEGRISFEVVCQEEVHQQVDSAWRKHQPGLWVLTVSRPNWKEWLFPSSTLSLDVSPVRSPVLALNRR
jgi:nucleotide-binding universal stress UspA family protein